MLKLAERLGFVTAAVYVQLYDLYRKQRKRQDHFHDGRLSWYAINRVSRRVV